MLALTTTSAAPHVALTSAPDPAPLDGQVELKGSWRQPARTIDALLRRRIGGKAVLHVD